jgi:hypothetical protein
VSGHVDRYVRHAERFGDPRTVYETAVQDGLPADRLLALGRRLVKIDPGEYREGRRTVKWPAFTWRWAERVYGDLPPGRIGGGQSVQIPEIGPGRTGRTGDSEPKSRLAPSAPALGERFGRLIVERAIKRDDGRTWLLCNCECGGSTLAKPSHLRRGEVVSCGCKRREDAAGRLRLFEVEEASQA